MTTGSAHSKTVNHLLAESTRKFGDKPAIGFAFKTPLTYSELHKQVCTLAVLLSRDGIPGNSSTGRHCRADFT
jgi:non-ribosomal peptide synthetase component E (peptide arylation enzyme)